MGKLMTKNEFQAAIADAWRKAAFEVMSEAGPQPFRLTIWCDEDPWTLSVSIQDAEECEHRTPLNESEKL